MTNIFRPIRKLRNETCRQIHRDARLGIVKPLTPHMGIYPSELANVTFTAQQEAKLAAIIEKAITRQLKPYQKQAAIMCKALNQGKQLLALMRRMIALYT